MLRRSHYLLNEVKKSLEINKKTVKFDEEERTWYFREITLHMNDLNLKFHGTAKHTGDLLASVKRF
jgi:hypothetical protein